ncbi:MAG TPA: porin [Burkholderiaceae bacterium]|nr:porin [Burkholderiaceae bacterium]
MKLNPCLFVLLAAFAGTASAESSLTLFGVVDVNLRYLKNADVHESQVGTDGITSSRIGFRGVEDIADGLRAGFHLESTVVPDTGNIAANGKFWQRRSTVSLYTRYGELRLGRDTVPTWLAYVDGDVYGTVGIGDGSKTYVALGNADTRLRSDNLVAFHLANNPWGIYGTIASAPAEGVSGRRYAGVRLGYRSGPLDVSAAYSETAATLANVNGTYKLAIVSGSFDMAFAKFYGVAQKTELLAASNVHVTLGVSVPVPGIGGTLKASYTRADGQGSLDANDAEQYVVGYIYDLSKRTAVYTTVSVIDNKGTANFSVGGIAGFTQPAGTKSQGVETGIRHSF